VAVEPYCNIVTFAVTPDGPAYRVTGFGDQCGAGKMPAAELSNQTGSLTTAVGSGALRLPTGGYNTVVIFTPGSRVGRPFAYASLRNTN
jgi:hypothetical protein